MTRDEWIREFAGELGLAPPDAEQIDAILELAATAAHASERTSAPLAAWLAGSSGRALDEVNAAAARIEDRAG